MSHINEKSFWDVVKIASAPIAATHSNCRALCDVPRNLTDDQLRAIRDLGLVRAMGSASKGGSTQMTKMLPSTPPLPRRSMWRRFSTSPPPRSRCTVTSVQMSECASKIFIVIYSPSQHKRGLNFQHGNIGEDLDLIDWYYDFGCRHAGLTRYR